MKGWGLRSFILSVVCVSFSSFVLSPKSVSAQNLTGGGSTFINPVMSQWTDTFRKSTGISINYQPIGSGGGINALIQHTVNFAGSDAPMSAQELGEARGGVLHLPVVIGAVAVAYNIPGVPMGLKFDGPLLSDIFLGKVRFWNDFRIARLNPGVKLPRSVIFVAHRSDGSGTSYIFTDYLCKVSPEWKARVGMGKSVAWPAGMGGKGNAGVAGLLQSHPNSIGYVELVYALQNHINFAYVQNQKGKFLLPSPMSAGAAAAGVVLPPNLCASITNTNNPAGYPISGFSWLIVRTVGPQAVPLKRFLHFVITDGQKYCTPLAYATIPVALRQRESKLIDLIH